MGMLLNSLADCPQYLLVHMLFPEPEGFVMCNITLSFAVSGMFCNLLTKLFV
jgi:hypothetical protein